jgi:hypothetical protein
MVRQLHWPKILTDVLELGCRVDVMRHILFLLAAPLAAASIHTDFEGGCLGRIEQVSPTHFRLGAKGEKDQDGRNRQANWYSFRVDGAPKSEMTLDMIDLPGEYNYQPNRGAITKDTPPLISYNGKTWKHVETFEYDAAEPHLRLRIRPQRARFWIAHVPPYTNQTLAALRRRIARHRDFREEAIGKTVGGRDLYVWTITSGEAPAARPAIWLMFRQHSWESGSSWVGEGAVLELLASTPEAAKLRRDFVWKIIPMADPDGVARGGVRFNANGYDLNRNWDVEDAVKMPEITAQRRAVKQWLAGRRRVDLFFSLHNTETGEYLEGPPDEGGQGKFRPLAEALMRRLQADTTFSPTTPLRYAASTTTAGMKGRMTVIQGLYHEFKIPGFLMEQRVSFNARLGHLPEVPDRLRFGGELVRAFAAALAEAGIQ